MIGCGAGKTLGAVDGVVLAFGAWVKLLVQDRRGMGFQVRHRLTSYPPIADWRVCARRSCNLAKMTAAERENPLQASMVEYCVHGTFFRSSDAAHSIPGAWWMPLVDLIDSFGRAGREELFELIEDYEKEQIAARK